MSWSAKAIRRRRREGAPPDPPRNGEVAARSADGGGPSWCSATSVGPLHQLRWSPSPYRGGLVMTSLPTRKLEAYRYADIDALRDVWDGLAQPERVEIAAQQKLQQIWL